MKSPRCPECPMKSVCAEKGSQKLSTGSRLPNGRGRAGQAHLGGWAMAGGTRRLTGLWSGLCACLLARRERVEVAVGGSNPARALEPTVTRT